MTTFQLEILRNYLMGDFTRKLPEAVNTMIAQIADSAPMYNDFLVSEVTLKVNLSYSSFLDIVDSAQKRHKKRAVKRTTSPKKRTATGRH